MATDNRQLDPAQISQLVAWLDEQRNLDRERITSVVKDLANIATQMSDIDGRLRNQDLQNAAVAEQISKTVTPEAEVRPLVDQLARQELKLEGLEEELQRQVSLNNVNVSQDKKVVIATAQRLERIERQLHADGQKTAAIHAEVSREQSLAATMPGNIEAVQRNINALTSKLLKFEDTDKRIEAASTQLNSVIDEGGTRIQQLENWSRLAEVRWSRQGDDLQGRMEVWRAEEDERARPVLAVAERVLGLQNQIDEVKSSVTDLVERVGKLEVEQRTTGLEQSRGTEKLQQLTAGQELFRQKLAEEASARWNVEESIHRAMGRLEEAQNTQKTMISTLDRATLELEQLERDKQALVSDRKSDKLQIQAEFAEMGGRLEQDLHNLQRDLMETQRSLADGLRLVFEQRRQLAASLEANLQDADQLDWLRRRTRSETPSDNATDNREAG